MIYAEILAGGTGKRFGNNDLPKQYNMLGSKPIIIHTIEQFVLNPKIDKIVVCTPKEWITYTEDLINKYIKGNNSIEVTEGGSTRNETIINGCKYIEKKYGLTDKDVIITHDAVRPFISQRIIEDNIKAVYDAGADIVVIGSKLYEARDKKEFIKKVQNVITNVKKAITDNPPARPSNPSVILTALLEATNTNNINKP